MSNNGYNIGKVEKKNRKTKKPGDECHPVFQSVKKVVFDRLAEVKKAPKPSKPKA